MKPKCEYCGKPIPAKSEDSMGRTNVKNARFCRGTNHYRIWWNANHKEHKKEQDRLRYLKRKERKLAEIKGIK